MYVFSKGSDYKYVSNYNFVTCFVECNFSIY